MKISLRLKWLRIFTETTKNQKSLVTSILLTVSYLAFLQSNIQPKDGIIFAAFTNALIFILLGRRYRP